MTAARTTPSAPPLNTHGTIALLAKVLAGLPALQRAACRDQSELFDPQQHGELADNAAARHAHAVEICRGCPALAQCRAWADRIQPTRRPGGVLAARLNPNPR